MPKLDSNTGTHFHTGTCMQAETWIGLGASICTGISMLPQLIKTYQEKKKGDISFVLLYIFNNRFRVVSLLINLNIF